MRTVIAIDPGASGGIAWMTGSEAIIGIVKMPETEGDIINLFRSIVTPRHDPVAFVERVGGFIAGRPAPGSRMFNFGRNYGFILGVLGALSIAVEPVEAHEWQKEMKVGKKGDQTPTKWKNKLKARAQQLYPELDITLSTADALLILDYGRRREKQAMQKFHV
jgi:hypothetical protein